jgi:signal transduction histidine kinase/CheY-like chemotaxis protein
LDAQVRTLEGSQSALARLWEAWYTPPGNIELMSETLLGLACLSMAAVIVATWVGRRRSSEIPSRGTVWMLGLCLVACGVSQLAQVILTEPWDPRAGTSLLAAVVCWAAAMTLRPVAVRALVPLRDEVVPEDASAAANRQRLEQVLRRSEAQVRKLAEADARKNQFLATLGHELRNPLAPIRNALRIIKRRGLDDPDLCWARDVIDHQLQQLGQLVDDLQEITRVTSGKVRLQRETVAVATLVAFAVETSRPTIEAHRHRLSIALPPEPVYVEADSVRMAQVLSNLLNNAAKYTPAGGQIRLAVAVEKSEAVFRVRDNGIGIAPEMLSRIFDLFAQVDHSLDRSQGGLGLGLTLVRSLVEMHGGSVQARSEGLGRGSEFIVCLPVLTEARPKAEPKPVTNAPAPASASAPGAAAAPNPSSASKEVTTAPTATAHRVLVVDDNTLSAQSMALILKLEGYEVQIAYDGESALQAVRSFRPEAVLMDIGLPGIDGHEVAWRLRQAPNLGSGIRLLVAVTGFADAEARHRSHEAGFDHHLVKPVDPEDVLALLASLEWAEETQTAKPS